MTAINSMHQEFELFLSERNIFMQLVSQADGQARCRYTINSLSDDYILNRVDWHSTVIPSSWVLDGRYLGIEYTISCNGGAKGRPVVRLYVGVESTMGKIIKHEFNSTVISILDAKNIKPANCKFYPNSGKRVNYHLLEIYPQLDLAEGCGSIFYEEYKKHEELIEEVGAVLKDLWERKKIRPEKTHKAYLIQDKI